MKRACLLAFAAFALLLSPLLSPAFLTAQQPQINREWLTVTPELARAQVLMPFAPTATERSL